MGTRRVAGALPRGASRIVTERPRLSTGQRVIVVLHALLAGAFFVSGSASPGGDDGFADLARLAVLLIVGIYVLATATVTAVARYFVSGRLIRTG